MAQGGLVGARAVSRLQRERWLTPARPTRPAGTASRNWRAR